MKKGVSPVIATILLVVLVVVIALIVFLWFKSISQEEIVKFDKNIELVCNDVALRTSYSSGTIFISNEGNVPVYGLKLKQVEPDGSFEITDLSTQNLNQGMSEEIIKNVNSPAYLIPVLRGNSNSGIKNFVCDKKEFQII